MTQIIALYHKANGKRVCIGDNNNALGVAGAIAQKLDATVAEMSVACCDKEPESSNVIEIGAGFGNDGAILNHLLSSHATTVWGVHQKSYEWQDVDAAVSILESIDYKFIPIYLFSQEENIALRSNGFILTEGIPHNRQAEHILSTLQKAESLELVSEDQINCVINLKASIPGRTISETIANRIGHTVGKALLSVEKQKQKPSTVFLELGSQLSENVVIQGLRESGYQGEVINGRVYFAEHDLNSLEVAEGMLNAYQDSMVIASVASSSVVTEFTDMVGSGKLYLVSPPYLGVDTVYQLQMMHYLATGYVHGYLDYKELSLVDINKHVRKKPLDRDIVANYLTSDL